MQWPFTFKNCSISVYGNAFIAGEEVGEYKYESMYEMKMKLRGEYSNYSSHTPVHV